MSNPVNTSPRRWHISAGWTKRATRWNASRHNRRSSISVGGKAPWLRPEDYALRARGRPSRGRQFKCLSEGVRKAASATATLDLSRRASFRHTAEGPIGSSVTLPSWVHNAACSSRIINQSRNVGFIGLLRCKSSVRIGESALGRHLPLAIPLANVCLVAIAQSKAGCLVFGQYRPSASARGVWPAEPALVAVAWPAAVWLVARNENGALPSSNALPATAAIARCGSFCCG